VDSRLRTNDRIKDWIPASAESTPRLEQKGSGGMTEAQGKDGPDRSQLDWCYA